MQKMILQEAILQALLRAVVLSLLLTAPATAEKMVDPATVAPEYKDAAEKRRTEQIKQRECARKADLEKVMPRERTAFLLQCLEADAQQEPGTVLALRSRPAHGLTERAAEL